MYSVNIIMFNIYLYYGETSTKSKFIDVTCSNEAYKNHCVAGHRKIAGNSTYTKQEINRLKIYLP